jgi:hypothetical protein
MSLFGNLIQKQLVSIAGNNNNNNKNDTTRKSFWWERINYNGPKN